MQQVLCSRETILVRQKESDSLTVIKGRWTLFFFIIGGLVAVLTKGNRLARDRKSISTLENRGNFVGRNTDCNYMCSFFLFVAFFSLSARGQEFKGNR